MKCLIRTLVFALLLSSLLAPSLEAVAEEEPDESSAQLSLSTGLQSYPAGTSFLFTQFGLHYWFGDHLNVGGFVKSGIVAADLVALASDDHLYTSFAFGPGLYTGAVGEGYTLHISPRVTHVHHATLESWGETPLSNLIADSNGGVRHRTGAQLAGGIIGSDFAGFWNWKAAWTADAVVDWLPTSSEMRWGWGVLVGMLIR